MNNLHLVFFTKLPQTWSNVVISTLSTCCEFDVTVSMLYRRFHHSIHDLLWGNVAPTLQIWRQSVNFVRVSCFWCHAFTLQQHCQYNIQKRLWAGSTIQRCNVGTEATLEQCCSFDIVVSTSLQSCELVIRRYYLPKRRQNVACLFGIWVLPHKTG